MARIDNYNNDNEISLEDKLLGTDNDNPLKPTKNYSVSSLRDFFLTGEDGLTQDNIFELVNLPQIINPSDEISVLEDASNLVNNLADFTISSKDIFLFSLRRGNRLFLLSLQGVGKGSYGLGGTQLEKSNFQVISQGNLNLGNIAQISTTDVIDLFNIGSSDVNDVVNLINPPIEIKQIKAGFTVFTATQNGEEKSWIYQGDSGEFGLNSGQTLLSDFEEITTSIIQNELKSLQGTQYVVVQANGTDTENATELQEAYDLAKTMSPSATNRITVIAAPANYNFDGSSFVMDTQYIDFVSLDGNRSIIFSGNGTISITANDVFVKGVDVLDKNFTIGDNLNLLKVENCKGGGNSFGAEVTASGTFTNCGGGAHSFGGFGTASGTFTNCGGGAYSFGGSGTASGTFTDCVGGNYSFGSFGTASGTFTDCVGGNYPFGSFGTLSGKLYYCRLTSGTFPTVSGGGVTVLCIDENNQINTQN